MRVRILSAAGYVNPRRGIMLRHGEVAELSDDLAARLINTRIAEAVPATKRPLETAEVAPPENTAKRTAKPAPKARSSSRPAKEEGTK